MSFQDSHLLNYHLPACSQWDARYCLPALTTWQHRVPLRSPQCPAGAFQRFFILVAHTEKHIVDKPKPFKVGKILCICDRFASVFKDNASLSVSVSSIYHQFIQLPRCLGRHLLSSLVFGMNPFPNSTAFKSNRFANSNRVVTHQRKPQGADEQNTPVELGNELFDDLVVTRSSDTAVQQYSTLGFHWIIHTQVVETASCHKVLSNGHQAFFISRGVGTNGLKHLETTT